MACIAPLQIEVRSGVYDPISRRFRHRVPVPCGKCLECRIRLINDWVFRLQEEWRTSRLCWFVTLTYDEVALAKYAVNFETGELTISKNEFRTWWKSVQDYQRRSTKFTTQEVEYLQRKSHKYLNANDLKKVRWKPKVFGVGEYGGDNGRPHYHAIVFDSFPKYIEDGWNGRGIVDCQPMKNIGGIRYVAGYLHKSLGQEFDSKEKPFRIMSDHIGRGYLFDQDNKETEQYKWHKKDLNERSYVMHDTGIKAPMPQYYKRILYNDEDKVHLRQHITNKMSEKYQDLEKEANRLGTTVEAMRHHKAMHRRAKDEFYQKNKKRSLKERL